MDSKIQFYRVGKILKGDDLGKYILIIPESGGLKIYSFDQSSIKNSKEIFDDWVEDMKALEKFFTASNWEIEWQEQEFLTSTKNKPSL